MDILEYSIHNIKELTGFRLKAWQRLTGFYSPALPKKFIQSFKFSIYGPVSKSIVYVEIDSVNFQFKMICYLEEKKIRVTLCELPPHLRRKRLALKAFKYQLNVAKSMQFKIIECKASAEMIKGNKDGGYIAWAKYGFTMDKESHKTFLKDERFTKIKTKDGKEEDCGCLQRLLLNKKGEESWITYGASWEAIFDLDKDSLNKRILKIYSRKKTNEDKTRKNWLGLTNFERPEDLN